MGLMDWLGGKDKISPEELNREVEARLAAKELAELEDKQARYEAERRSLFNDLDRCKDAVTLVENALRAKKVEYDAAGVSVKQIVAREIQQLAKKLQLMRGEQDAVLAKLDQCDAIIAKFREAIVAKRSAAIGRDAQDLSLVFGEAQTEMAGDMKAIDELVGLGGVTSGLAASAADIDVDAIMGSLGLDAAAPVPEAPAVAVASDPQPAAEPIPAPAAVEPAVPISEPAPEPAHVSAVEEPEPAPTAAAPASSDPELDDLLRTLGMAPAQPAPSQPAAAESAPAQRSADLDDDCDE